MDGAGDAAAMDDGVAVVDGDDAADVVARGESVVIAEQVLCVLSAVNSGAQSVH